MGGRLVFLVVMRSLPQIVAAIRWVRGLGKHDHTGR